MRQAETLIVVLELFDVRHLEGAQLVVFGIQQSKAVAHRHGVVEWVHIGQTLRGTAHLAQALVTHGLNCQTFRVLVAPFVEIKVVQWVEEAKLLGKTLLEFEFNLAPVGTPVAGSLAHKDRVSLVLLAVFEEVHSLAYEHPGGVHVGHDALHTVNCLLLLMGSKEVEVGDAPEKQFVVAEPGTLA